MGNGNGVQAAGSLEEAASTYFFDAARRLAQAIGLPDPISSDEGIRALLGKYGSIEDPSRLFGEQHPRYSTALKEKEAIEDGMSRLPIASREAVRKTLEAQIAEQQKIIDAHESSRNRFLKLIGGFSKLQNYIATIQGIDTDITTMLNSIEPSIEPAAELNGNYLSQRRRVVLEVLLIGKNNAQEIGVIADKVRDVSGFADVNLRRIRHDIKYLIELGKAGVTGFGVKTCYYRAAEGEQPSPVDLVAKKYGIKYDANIVGFRENCRTIFEIVAKEGPITSPEITGKLQEAGHEFSLTSRQKYINHFLQEQVFRGEGTKPQRYSVKSLKYYRARAVREGIEYVLKQVEGMMEPREILTAAQPMVDVAINRDNNLYYALKQLANGGILVHSRGKYGWNHERVEEVVEIHYQDGSGGLPDAVRDMFNETLRDYISLSANPILKKLAEVYLDDVLSKLRIDEEQGKVYFPDSKEDVSHLRFITPDELGLVCRKGIEVLMESMQTMEQNKGEVLPLVQKEDFLYIMAKGILEPVFTGLYGQKFANEMIIGHVHGAPAK